ncbi:MAG: hypothetical protein DIU78_019330, partial [Pseudomonadota bacterium]
EDGGATPQPTRSGQNPRATATRTATSSLPRMGETNRSTPANLPTSVQAQPQARQLTIEVCTQGAKKDQCGEPLADMQIEVLLASSNTLVATARTDRAGTVALSVSVSSSTQLVVRLPHLGTVHVIPNGQNVRLSLHLPGGSKGAGQ